MKHLVAVLFLTPLLFACSSLTPEHFDFDGYNVPRRTTIEFKVQDKTSSGPIIVSGRFSGDIDVKYCNDITSYCNTEYDVPVLVIDYKTGNRLAGPTMCSVSQDRVNTVVYYELNGNGQIDCEGQRHDVWWEIKSASGN